jgi:hypothetical protein
MAPFRLILLLLVFAGVCQAQPPPEKPSGTSQDPLRDPPASDEAASKRQLFRLMDELEPKLPPELKRKLIIISMKLATGWCSPYLAVEFEDEIGKLSADTRRGFETEWKAVREHKSWPRMPQPKSDRPVT